MLTEADITAEVALIVAKCRTAAMYLSTPDAAWSVYELGRTALNHLAGPRAVHQVEACRTEAFFNWALKCLDDGLK